MPLRQKHYVAVRARHQWPYLKALERAGKDSGITGFQAMLDEGRRRRRERREHGERDAA